MELQELQTLEAQINKLIELIQRLKIENESLRTQLASRTHEKVAHSSLHPQQTIQKIKSVIQQLKEEMA